MADKALLESKWPGLSLKERDRRWGRVKELMKSRGVECLVVFGLKDGAQHDGYLTNDRTGGITIFPLNGEMVQLWWHPQYIAAHLESSNRGEVSWVQDVRLGTSGASVVAMLKEKGFETANIGVVGVNIYTTGQVEGYVPYSTWTYILNNMPNAKFNEISNAFAELVLVKSEEELRLVRRAAEIGEQACAKMMKVSRPGVSESEIYAEVMYELFINGANGCLMPYATPLLLHTGPDNPSWGSPIWLIRGQAPRIVQKGDLVQAEIFPRYGGIESQQQMSIAIKPVSQLNKECAAIARQSYLAGFKALRPGNTFGQVLEAMEEPLKQAEAWNLTPLIHCLNPLFCSGRKGVGMDKLPGIERYHWKAHMQAARTDLVIQANTIWELEPNACLGKNRVNIGGTVVITDSGAVDLNVLPTEMRIID